MEIATAKVIKAVTQINLCSNQVDNCDSFRHYTNLEYPVESIELTFFRSEFQALQDNIVRYPLIIRFIPNPGAAE